ncbi:hypothetical protein ST47_g3154 [Ascochyta rabiei]|uniref:Uncharacterized protein n=2 Tax=Didymella rabiei TaxID=5454 RepID=A0A163IBV6_DIDRA|nr:hypothetical protein ST47_g3154 [Ascochyta rabiei]
MSSPNVYPRTSAAGEDKKAAFLSLMSSARSDCLSLSALMYKKLPREIRDVIYCYICLEDRQIPIGPYYHFRKYDLLERDVERTLEADQIKPSSDEQHAETWLFSHVDAQTILPDGRIRTDHDVYPQDDFLMPENHIFNPDYMGENVALETLQVYYKSNSFSVCNVEGGLDSLCTSIKLSSKEMAVDCVPIDYISDLQIRVKCEHFDVQRSSPSDILRSRLEGFAEEERLLRRTVESLARFRSKVRTSTPRELNVEIVLMSDLKSGSEWDSVYLQARIINMLQAMRTCIYELMHEREYTTIRVTHQDDGLMAFPKTYTGLFQLTKEQWNYEKCKQRPNHDWTQDFWILPIEGDELSEDDFRRLGGYYINCKDSFLAERWGTSNVLHDTNSKSPVVEGFAWPIGCPYNAAAAYVLCERL